MYKTNEEELAEIKLSIIEAKEDAKNSTDLKVVYELHFDRKNHSIKVILREINENGKVFFVNQLCESVSSEQELQLLAEVLNHITPKKINFDGLESEYDFMNASRFIIKRLEKENLKNIVMTKD